MTYTFRKQLLDSKRYKYTHPTKRDKDGKPLMVYKSGYSMTPRYITVHNTANDAPAANEANYHNRTDNHNSTSYHVAIDDKEAVQVLPFNHNAYHCGDGGQANSGNRTSIGIEICYSKSGGPRYVRAEENAVHYIAKLLHERGWGVDRLRQHYDWSRKNCPHRIRDEKRWDSFVARVRARLNTLNKPQPKPPVIPQIETEGIKLNETGRKEIRALLKKAREKGIIDAKVHTVDKINKYTDVQLLSYQAAVINRTFK